MDFVDLLPFLNCVFILTPHNFS